MKNLRPRCLDGDPLGYSATGYILPCCRCDMPSLHTGQIKQLVQEKFAINCVHSVQDVLQSTEWQDFYHMLVDSPDNAPDHCWEYCGPNSKIKREKQIK